VHRIAESPALLLILAMCRVETESDL
jgi:hypothetical protein